MGWRDNNQGSLKAVAPTTSRLLVKRGGSSITGKIPKPIAIVDTREQLPLSFARFPNWIAGERRDTVPVGDYTVEGMEDLLALERKSLEDLVGTLTHSRERFIRMCEKLACLKYKAILVECTYEDVKSPYPGEFSSAHPNGISGSLDAIEARWGIPVIYTSRHRVLAEEKAASWLSKHWTYHYLETNNMGRCLQEGDL